MAIITVLGCDVFFIPWQSCFCFCTGNKSDNMISCFLKGIVQLKTKIVFICKMYFHLTADGVQCCFVETFSNEIFKKYLLLFFTEENKSYMFGVTWGEYIYIYMCVCIIYVYVFWGAFLAFKYKYIKLLTLTLNIYLCFTFTTKEQNGILNQSYRFGVGCINNDNLPFLCELFL